MVLFQLFDFHHPPNKTAYLFQTSNQARKPSPILPCLQIERLRRHPNLYTAVETLEFLQFGRQYLLARQHQRGLAALVDVTHQLDRPLMCKPNSPPRLKSVDADWRSTVRRSHPNNP